MAQKIGKAMKFFWMQFIDRPSMCFSCRPCRFLRKKFLHVWERTRCCSCVCLSTQGTFRTTTAKIASKESRELVCMTVARLSFVATWHEEALLSKEVLWEFRRVETQGRRDADGEGHKTVSEMKLKFVMRAT